MSREGVTRRLREAIDAFAADRAPELVADARAEALAEVRRVLVEAMTTSLLAESQRALGPSRETTRRPPSRSGPRRERTKPPSQAGGGLAPPAAGQPADQGARPQPAGQGARPERDAELADYVYGVVSSRAEIPGDLAGIDPRYEVSLVTERDLAALVSHVSLAEFGEGPLHENLNDVGWLEEKARAHEHVLDVALERATVVPLRLCTIYSGDEQVRAMLAEERAVMIDALERLHGRAEWGVKAIAEPGAVARAATKRSGGDPEAGDAPRGTAYMNRKRREAQSRVAGEEIATEWAAAIHAPLAEVASEARSNPLQRPELSGHEGDMLLNGVYLVDDGSIAEFSALVDRLAEEWRQLGVSVELTGPWPPYHFVERPIESAR